MALSRQVIISDGTTTEYPITFADGYLSRDEVSVYEEFDDGTPNADIAFIFINDYLIELSRVPAAGHKIVIERDVEADARKVNFIPQYIKSSDLNTMYKHLLYLIQSVLDGRFEEAIIKDLDMGYNRIYNLGAPQQPNDAVRLVDIKEYTDLAENLNQQNAAHETAAKQSEINAKASEVTASNAAADAIAAKNYAEAAITDDNLITVATDLKATPSNIKTVASNIASVNDVAMIKDDVVTVAEASSEVMTVADNIADVKNVSNNIQDVKNAVVSAANAKTSETNAKASENNAKTSETNAHIWAEGNDPDVTNLGGTHSAKGWAELAQSVVDVHPASETVTGIVRLSTTAEAKEGFDDASAITPLKLAQVVADNVGRGVQLGFTGTLVGNLLTFETTDPNPYTLRHNYDYEIDLLFEAVGELPDNVEIVIKNGTNYINIVNVLHDDYTSHITVGDLKQIMKYSNNIGWRWIFMARYTVASSGQTVFVMPSTVVNVAGEGIYNKIHDALVANPDMVHYENDVNLIRILAGSTFVKPNGVNTFERITLSTNISTNVLPDHNQLIFSDGVHLYYIDADKTFSQATAPTAYSTMLWYDTTTNKIKYTGNSGATWQEGYCLPFGTANSSGIIDCFCNGIGYFASCVWILDGVKVLIPSGKNKDGTFNNIVHTVARPAIKVFTDTREGQWALTTSNDIFVGTQGFKLTNDNKIINIVSNGVINGCPMGDFKTNVGRVEMLTVRDILDLAKEEESITIEYVD